MRIEVPAGKYVLAVSGGVDSMVLLDLLSNLPEADVIVAHYDHGIRLDSTLDERLVKAAAARYGLDYRAGRGQLGAGASEQVARDARYDFLRRLMAETGADKIITAHHQDDWIETAFINILRGTGWRGLSSIGSNPDVLRPLLPVPKREIIAYARVHHLVWREDSTNADDGYLRNYLRRRILAKMTGEQRRQIVARLSQIQSLHDEIEREVGDILWQPKIIERDTFIQLPVVVGNEILIEWLRRQSVSGYDSGTIGRLGTAIRIARPHTIHHVRGNVRLKVGTKKAELSVA